MRSNDFELDALRSEMDAAQRSIDSAKSRLDPIALRRDSLKREIESCKYRIDDAKRHMSAEYDAMKICFQARDKLGAENHKYNAQCFKAELQREYKIKESYYGTLNILKSDYDAALSELKAAKARKQRARDAFDSRLEILKAESKKRKDNWKETTCKCCGTIIQYHIDWDRIPDMCKPCREKEKLKWHDTTCRKCGKTIRYHEDWTRIPYLCKDCKIRVSA